MEMGSVPVRAGGRAGTADVRAASPAARAAPRAASAFAWRRTTLRGRPLAGGDAVVGAASPVGGVEGRPV